MKAFLRAIGTQRWLRLGIRRRLVEAFYPVASSPSFPFSVFYAGIVYHGNIAVAQEWHVYFFGGYELKECSLINDVLSRMDNPLVFDIGANLGCHTFIMARHAREVHAFEPFGPLAARIEYQVKRNAVENVRVHRFGLGDVVGTKAYYLDLSSSNSGTGSFIAEHSGAEAVGELPILRGDEWTEGRCPDFVKIDVEGYEALVLKGMIETLRRSEPLILMEVTETSARLFGAHGGLQAILPYDFDLYEVCNPKSIAGLFCRGMYRLERVSILQARRASFNFLIVPHSRREVVACLD